MSKHTTRCACGAYVGPCKACGRIPGQPEAQDLFDYQPNAARIDRRVRDLFMRDRVDEFIKGEVAA